MMLSFAFSPDQEELRSRAREYAEGLRAEVARWDRDDAMDMHAVVRQAYEHGLTGVTLPARYGGPDLGAVEWTIIIEECARASGSWLAGDPTFMTSGPGPMIVLASGSEEARQEVLPALVRGDAYVAIAITEPHAGSGMTDLTTQAVTNGDGVVISGKKRYITAAGEADYLVTFCRFDGIPGAKGVGAVLVGRDDPGVEYGRNPEWLGLRGIPHCEVTFKETPVPPERVLFGAGNLRRLMLAFNYERLHNATLSLGLAEAALDAARAFVAEREQFGRPVIDFQGVQWQVADMYTEVEAARLLVYKAASTAVDGKYPTALDVSAAKLFANEMAIRVAYTAAQLHGGLGFTSDVELERILRDVVVMPVAGGTPNILRNGIASELFPDRRFPQRLPEAPRG
jgi:butyryl-CoA dehydrogenase